METIFGKYNDVEILIIRKARGWVEYPLIHNPDDNDDRFLALHAEPSMTLSNLTMSASQVTSTVVSYLERFQGALTSLFGFILLQDNPSLPYWERCDGAEDILTVHFIHWVASHKTALEFR